jgi:hypothetical protein
VTMGGERQRAVRQRGVVRARFLAVVSVNQGMGDSPSARTRRAAPRAGARACRREEDEAGRGPPIAPSAAERITSADIAVCGVGGGTLE